MFDWNDSVGFEQEYNLVDDSPRLLSQLNPSLDLKLYLKAGRKYQARRIISFILNYSKKNQ